MLPELSLHVLDIAMNSVRAGAKLVTIELEEDGALLTIRIRDDGCGMTQEQVRAVTDPFFTTRKTRKVGLGVPFFKMAAELTGGRFSIRSAPGRGTETEAVFDRSSIDCMPLGDLAETLVTLVQGAPDIDFVYRHTAPGRAPYEFDTRQVREALGGDVPLSDPAVLVWMRQELEGEA